MSKVDPKGKKHEVGQILSWVTQYNTVLNDTLTLYIIFVDFEKVFDSCSSWVPVETHTELWNLSKNN